MTRKQVAAAMLAVGCSASSPPAMTTFATTPIGEATSSSGAYVVKMYGPANQDGLVRGINTIQTVITQAGSPAPDSMNLAIVPWMPAMGHGTSAVPEVTPMGAGTYVVTDLVLFMSGTWQLRTSLRDDSAIITVVIQ